MAALAGTPLTEHPRRRELMRFATVDLHAAEMAFMAFVDLSEGKNWVDVDVRHYEARELTYIVGRQGIGMSLEAVLAVSADEQLSLAWVHEVMSEIPDPEKPHLAATSVVLCIMSDDSTTVYYRVHGGIRPPPKSFILTGVEEEEEEN